MKSKYLRLRALDDTPTIVESYENVEPDHGWKIEYETPILTGVYDHTTFFIGNKLYICGGCLKSGNPTSTMDIYDIVTNRIYR